MANNLKISPSDLGRKAIEEYITRQTNPEIYNKIDSDNTNALRFEEVETKLDSLIKLVEKQALLNSQMLDIQMKIPSGIKEFENIEEYISKISQIIKKHQESPMYKKNKTAITMGEIIDQSGLNEDIVFDILTNTDKFRPIKRGWDLNE